MFSELTNDTKTHKIRAGSDLQHDIHWIILKFTANSSMWGSLTLVPMTLCGYRILTLQQHAGCRGNGITIHNDVCLIALPVLDDASS